MDRKKDSVVALIMCAGSGTRSGLTFNKVLHFLGKKTVLEYVLDSFALSKAEKTILVCAKNDIAQIESIASEYENVSIVEGGDTRTQSVRNGLEAAKKFSPDIVCIHDGARPYIDSKIIDESILSALEFGSGIVAVPVIDTIKQVDGFEVLSTLERDKLYSVQTPQTFSFEEIYRAYQQIEGTFTDDSAVYEKAGHTSRIVKGDYSNIKITTPEDLLKIHSEKVKIGIGFDVHQLVFGRKLILGGIEIAHDKGLLGHSDADVLTHAIMDALLSAANLPDIGVLFPDTDNQYKNIDSLILLEKVINKVYNLGYKVGNISAVIMAQKPKLAPFIPRMQENIARVLKISANSVTISVTTTEKLGIVGQEQGMSSGASCLLL